MFPIEIDQIQQLIRSHLSPFWNKSLSTHHFLLLLLRSFIHIRMKIRNHSLDQIEISLQNDKYSIRIFCEIGLVGEISNTHLFKARTFCLGGIVSYTKPPRQILNLNSNYNSIIISHNFRTNSMNNNNVTT